MRDRHTRLRAEVKTSNSGEFRSRVQQGSKTWLFWNLRLEFIVVPFQLDLSSAAVNEQFDTRDETGVIRRQKQRYLSNFLRFSHAPHRDGGHNPPNHVCRLTAHQRRIDRTRTNNV